MQFARSIAFALLSSIALPLAAADFDTDFAAATQALLDSGAHPYLLQPRMDRERYALQSAYDANGNRPLWIREREISRQGMMVLQTLRSAAEFGLRPDDYEGNRLAYDAINLLTDAGAPVSRWAELDLGISLAAARMIRHLHFGRVDPRAAGFDLEKPRSALDTAAVLRKLSRSENIEADLAQVEPQFLHYELVKAALRRYRILAIDRELTALPAFKARSIKPGDTYEGIPALRRFLVALGDIDQSTVTSDSVLDEPMVEALKRFQTRHGLAADGALGRNTFAALTTPLAARVKQLEYALERFRWLPEFDTPPIIVNIPQYRLFAFRTLHDRAADILQMDVIVGQTYPRHQTPVFGGEMKYLVFRPYWDVPYSIMKNEMLPQISANPKYLERHNLEIVSGNNPNSSPLAATPETIEGLANGKLRLRQRPGDDNSLGLLKFMLPNHYNVYLHSTPAQNLFGESRRAFSHGCIRVSDPVALAEHVLRNETKTDGTPWTRADITTAMQSDDNRHVFLSKPVPVFIVYSTAMTLEDGGVLFFEDIYGHDQKLQKLLGR